MKRLRFECVIPEQNKSAFYELATGRDLFGFVLLRCFGRIGGRGRCLKTRFATETAMLAARDSLQEKRLKRGYIPV